MAIKTLPRFDFTDEVVLPSEGRGIRLVWVEVALAAVAFAALCVVALSVVGPRVASLGSRLRRQRGHLQYPDLQQPAGARVPAL
jgi:hypothetical protein